VLCVDERNPTRTNSLSVCGVWTDLQSQGAAVSSVFTFTATEPTITIYNRANVSGIINAYQIRKIS